MVYAYVMGKRFYRPPKWLTTGEKTGSQFFMPKGAIMWKILLEIFGYIGTGLVLLSMAMTSMKKLRILNMAGSVISAIYSAICGARGRFKRWAYYYQPCQAFHREGRWRGKEITSNYHIIKKPYAWFCVWLLLYGIGFKKDGLPLKPHKRRFLLSLS